MRKYIRLHESQVNEWLEQNDWPTILQMCGVVVNNISVYVLLIYDD